MERFDGKNMPNYTLLFIVNIKFNKDTKEILIDAYPSYYCQNITRYGGTADGGWESKTYV